MTQQERLDRCAAAALATANEIRNRFGLPPQPALVPGIPRDHCECPLARTIAGDVDNMTASVGTLTVGINHGDDIELNEDTSLFVQTFDTIPNLTYPELIAPEGRFAIRPGM